MIERLLAADAALERGEVDVAERLFAQVAEADPRNAIALVGLARLAIRDGDRATATDRLRRALEIDPEEAAAQRLLAELASGIATAGAPEAVAAATPVEPEAAAEPSSRPAAGPEAGTAAAPGPQRHREEPQAAGRSLLDRLLRLLGLRRG